jgi:regulator of sigma E protease
MILIYGLLIFTFIIFIHELGHFVFGKAIGLNFMTFSVGMGPRIYKRRIGNTYYCLSILPIGGYVFSDAHEEDDSVEHHWFFKYIIHFLVPISQEEKDLAKELKSKISVAADKRSFIGYALYLLGGSVFNVLSGLFVMLLYLYFFHPVAKYGKEPVIGRISENGVAVHYGFKSGDVVKEVNGNKIYHWGNALYYLVNAKREERYNFTVQRFSEGKVEEFSLSLPERFDEETRKEESALTLNYYKALFKYPFGLRDRTFKEALNDTWTINIGLLSDMFNGLMNFSSLKKKKAHETNNVGMSPVGSASELGLLASESMKAFVALFLCISVMVGLVNLLPFPASDGCQLAILVLEKIFMVPVTFKQKLYISYSGLTVFLLITIYSCYADFIKAYF